MNHPSVRDIVLQLAQDSEPSRRAVGWNLLSDERISSARIEHFLRVVGLPRSADELARALVDYHRLWVCPQPYETYLSDERNGHNLVPVVAGRTLGTVLNVSAVVERIRTRRGVGVRIERDFAKLTALPIPPPQAAIQYFLDQLFYTMSSLSESRPVWVAEWDALEPAIEPGDASSWNRAVGVWRRAGSWQIVLRYPAEDVGQLVRPTMLDAGFNQFHFPSPPIFPQPKGGITMALEDPMPVRPLISEWIHRPISFKTEYWIAAGGLCASVVSDAPAPISLYRSNHRERLTRAFPTGITNWLPAY